MKFPSLFLAFALPFSPSVTALAGQSPAFRDAAAPTAADRAQVERMVYDFEAAWNRHDMVAFANLFHDDAAWVHWRGGLWVGRPAIYEGHRIIHETYYRNTRATVQRIEALDFLSPTVAYLRVRSNMVGDERSPGQMFRYRRTMILTLRDGVWRIARGHNTRIADGLD
jgi:uncharacterized protein (TIGR02246 family)